MTTATVDDLRAMQAKGRADAAVQARAAREKTIRDLLTGQGPTDSAGILVALDSAGISLDEFESLKTENDRAWRQLRQIKVDTLVADGAAYDEHQSAWQDAQLRWEHIGRFVDPRRTHGQFLESLTAVTQVAVSDADRPAFDAYVTAVKTALDAYMVTFSLETKNRELLRTKTRCELVLSKPLRDRLNDAGLVQSIASVTKELDAIAPQSKAATAALVTAMQAVLRTRAALPQLAD